MMATLSGVGFAFVTGLRDLRFVTGRVLAVMVHAAILSMLVGLGAGWVAQSFLDVNAARRLQGVKAVYLVAGNTVSTPSKAQTDRLRTALIEVLEAKRGYIFLPENRQLGTPVIAMGAIHYVLGDHEPSTAPPYAIVGKKTGLTIGDTVTSQGRDFPVAEIQKDAGYLDLWMQYTDLTDSIVVVEDPRATISTASVEQLAILATRLVLVDPSPTELSEVIAATRGVVPAFPRSALDKVDLDFSPELQGRAAFLAVFSTTLLASILGLVTGLQAMLRARQRSFVLHSHMGASTAAIGTRLSVFVATAWTMPVLIFSALGLRLAAGTTTFTAWALIALSCVTVSAAVILLAVRLVRSADVVSQIRKG